MNRKLILVSGLAALAALALVVAPFGCQTVPPNAPPAPNLSPTAAPTGVPGPVSTVAPLPSATTPQSYPQIYRVTRITPKDAPDTLRGSIGVKFFGPVLLRSNGAALVPVRLFFDEYNRQHKAQISYYWKNGEGILVGWHHQQPTYLLYQTSYLPLERMEVLSNLTAHRNEDALPFLDN